jgi:hypothetical protein
MDTMAFTYLTAALLSFGSILLNNNSLAQAYVPEKVNPDTLISHSLRDVDYSAFKAGEELTYTVHYGWIDAGTAVLSLNESPYDFEARKAFHVVGTGTSLGAFDWFFKVRDHYETYFDQNGLFPYRFVRDCDEGGYKVRQDYEFNPKKSVVSTEKGDTLLTPVFVQDMISAFYYARTLDFSRAKKDDIYEIPTIVDGEIFPLKIKYVGKENISLRTGKFRCMKFVPVVQEGRIFKNEKDLNVWITDDENKIPILVKSKILVGSIKMEVTGWEGLANPIAKLD